MTKERLDEIDRELARLLYQHGGYSMVQELIAELRRFLWVSEIFEKVNKSSS